MKTKQTPAREENPAELKREEGWVYGLNPVLEAVRAGRGTAGVYVSAGRHEKVAELRREAGMRGISVKVVAPEFFDQRFPKGHQGVAARVASKRYFELDELLMVPSRRKEAPLYLILDGIEDPRNFGAILRSCDAAGVHGVVIQSHRSVTLGPEVAKSSAGAVEYMPVSVVPNIKHAIRRMKDEGITVVGAEADAPETLWDVDLRVPLSLVIGSEGRGLRKTVRENCDAIVSLPLRGKINSLNVSVATGIVLFEAVRQRFAEKGH